MNILGKIGKIVLNVIEKESFMFGEIVDNLSEFKEENYFYGSINFRQKVFLEVYTSKDFLKEMTSNMSGIEIEEMEKDMEKDSSSLLHWELLMSDTLGEMLNMVMGNFLIVSMGEYEASDLSTPTVKMVSKEDLKKHKKINSNYINFIFEDIYPLIIFINKNE